jgi:hypothetical protein
LPFDQKTSEIDLEYDAKLLNLRFSLLEIEKCVIISGNMSTADRKKALLKPYVPIQPLSDSINITNEQKHPRQILEVRYILNQIFPNEVIFTDILLNQTHEITLTIRNITSQARKVRIFVPITPYFSVRYDQKITSLASGLPMKVTVAFDAKEK